MVRRDMILEKTGEKRDLLECIKGRKPIWLGDILRQNYHTGNITEDKIKGRSRGGQDDSY